jgi:hypothetical protein
MLCDGTSDLRVSIPLTNAINKQVLDMMVASEFAAFPQRVLIGVELPKDPVTNQPLASTELTATSRGSGTSRTVQRASSSWPRPT